VQGRGVKEKGIEVGGLVVVWEDECDLNVVDVVLCYFGLKCQIKCVI